ncbi:MAG: hypothetical protein ACPGYK_04540 [Flavobacteriales bacterium]
MRDTKTQAPEAKAKGWRRRFQAMGWGAFLFFLLKGLAWLAVFYGLWSC